MATNLAQEMSTLEGREANEGEEISRNVAAAAYAGKSPAIDREVGSLTIMPNQEERTP